MEKTWSWAIPVKKRSISSKNINYLHSFLSSRLHRFDLLTRIKMMKTSRRLFVLFSRIIDLISYEWCSNRIIDRSLNMEIIVPTNQPNILTEKILIIHFDCCWRHIGPMLCHIWAFNERWKRWFSQVKRCSNVAFFFSQMVVGV